MWNPNVQLSDIKVSLKLPFIGEVAGSWQPDESERKAAWEMYVELVTRISVVPLAPNEGLLREALSSLHSLFDTTRKILRSYGPAIAQPKNKGDLSFGYIAVAVLNTAIRPVLAKWHPLLLDYEAHKESSVSQAEWEAKWGRNEELRETLEKTRVVLTDYANLLADVANVPSLIIEPSPPESQKSNIEG